MLFVPGSIRLRAWLRRTAWLAALLLMVGGLAWLAGPPLIRQQIETRATEILGRQVKIGRVDFRPWNLELDLHDIAVAGPAASPDQLRIARVRANAAWQTLWRFAPVVDSLDIEAPVFTLTHFGQGHYDIDDLLTRLATRPAQPGGKPPRFALYNVRLQRGSIDFTDRPVGRLHAVREIQLSLPFLSNLPAHRDIRTQPRLAFLLNGGRFDSQAAATPFAASGQADARLQLAEFDLAPYVRYLPPGLPVLPQAALLDADLRVEFVQSPQPALAISGSLQLRQARVASAKGGDLLALDALALELADVRPLERKAHLAALTLTGPRLLLVRDRGGQLNAGLPASPPSEALPQSPATADAQRDTGWRVVLDRFALRDGQLGWIDESLTPVARAQVREFQLEATALAWPLATASPFKGAMVLDAPSFQAGRSAFPAASLRFEGSAGAQAATVAASLSGLPLEAAAPYMARWFGPRLSGSLHADLQFDWSASQEPAKPGRALLRLAQLSVSQLALSQGRNPAVGVERLHLQDGQIDLAARTLTIGRLSLAQPRVRLERHADGQWMFAHWVKEPGAAQPAEAAEASPPWVFTVREATVDGGVLAYRDQSTPRPVALDITALRLQARDLSPQGRQPASLELSARMGAGQAEPGTLNWRGSVHLARQTLQGELRAQHLPLHTLEPYFADRLNVELLRADTSFTGRMEYAIAGPRLRLQGDAAVEDLRVHTMARTELAGEELLSWKALNLRGLDVASTGTATSVEVRDTVLSDFYARLVVQENGRINLQDLVRHGAVRSDTPAAARSGAAAQAEPDAASVLTASSAPAVSSAPPTPSTRAAPDAQIRFGPVTLLNGKVDFSDRFVRPSYSARLSELTGRLGAFSSTPVQGAPQLADLELRGRAEGTASLEITGKLNPLAQPLALDIKGRVRDLELPPLSPYSVKYAGHGIERGKLSLDVAYQVQPDGQLTASNKLVLNQLVFGDKVEGASASLPVKLAVALLADRHGVIDLDLPVSGSLNDPQFSLGPVIFKLIANLVVKAIASPFTLLAHALGGGSDEMNMVGFPPGSAQLDASARASLDKVAQALVERPALRMTVVGTASLEVEREAYRRERLRAMLLAEKRRGALRESAAPMVAAASRPAAAASGAVLAVQPAEDETELAPGESAVLLKEVYRRADFPKPRNLLGLAKELPAPEMEALLLAQIPVTEEHVRELALARSVAVRDYLASRQMPTERLFLGAAKAVAPEAKWSPRAELQLAAP